MLKTPLLILVLFVVTSILGIEAYLALHPQSSPTAPTKQPSPSPTLNTSNQNVKFISQIITDCSAPEVDKSNIAFSDVANNFYGLRGKLLAIGDATSGKQ